jgi:multiple sugar transport system ATP-binding protein
LSRVKVDDVSKAFKGSMVVDRLNLEVADGEFLVLVGPSGCGKSTTLNMIAGLESPSAGRIIIGEQDVTHLPPKSRGVAMVFQNYALYPHLTVAGNLGFALTIAKTPIAEVRRRVTAIAETLGIVELLERRPRELSGGQRQRVALGRAIVRDPAVFLFDEPLSNLDAQLRVQMRFELKQLHGRLHATAIYVTHDQVEAMTLGSRVVVMDRGVVQQVGAPLEIYERPRNRFVAQFMGSPAMNFITGIPEGRGARISLVVGSRWIAVPADKTRMLEQANLSQVVFGIRPEHLLVTREPTEVSWPARVETVDALGNQTLLNLDLDGQRLVAAASPTCPFKPQDNVNVIVDPEHINLFVPGSHGAAM